MDCVLWLLNDIHKNNRINIHKNFSCKRYAPILGDIPPGLQCSYQIKYTPFIQCSLQSHYLSESDCFYNNSSGIALMLTCKKLSLEFSHSPIYIHIFRKICRLFTCSHNFSSHQSFGGVCHLPLCLHQYKNSLSRSYL